MTLGTVIRMGKIVVAECCTFVWKQPKLGSHERLIEITDEHCRTCVHELRQMIDAERVTIIDRRTRNDPTPTSPR
jgi:hypothetical protein